MFSIYDDADEIYVLAAKKQLKYIIFIYILVLLHAKVLELVFNTNMEFNTETLITKEKKLGDFLS